MIFLVAEPKLQMNHVLPLVIVFFNVDGMQETRFDPSTGRP